jgi:hypothetical protein
VRALVILADNVRDNGDPAKSRSIDRSYTLAGQAATDGTAVSSALDGKTFERLVRDEH